MAVKAGRNVFTWLGGVLALIIATTLVMVWTFGPVWGVSIVGKPVFLLPPSPERYAHAVFDMAERQGLHAGSAEFAEVRARAEEAVKDAESAADTYPHIDSVLTAAGGKHSTLLVPGSIPEQRTQGSLPSVDVNGRVASVSLPATDVEWDNAAYMDAAAPPLIGALNDGACAAVVDLRGNTGGDLGPMLASVSALLPDGEVLWFSTPLYDKPVMITGNSVQGGGTPMTAPVDGKFQVPVAVLVDGMTASSGEATMLAFRGMDNSRSFGMPTAGYASANISFEMPDGARVLLSTANDKARTGEVFGDDPIEPDVVTTSAERAAHEWISQQGCVDPTLD